MSTNPVRSIDPTTVTKADMKVEVIVIPVSDVDRAKQFYTNLDWRLDADFPFDNGFRVVQFTPPGSACSVQFGARITSVAPGSARGMYLVVSGYPELPAMRLPRAALTSARFSTQRPPALSFSRATPAVTYVGAGAQSPHLRLLRHIQRPRRQQLVAAGNYNAAPRPSRSRKDHLRLRR